MKRSEARRSAIMAAAAEVFAESGFDRASMSHIGQRTSFSKTTLYGYFASKEVVMGALVEEATESGLGVIHAALAGPAADLVATLERFAGAYLAFSLSPLVRTLRRLLVATAGRPDVDPPRCRDLGAARIDAALAHYLRAQMDAGTLRRGDANGSARQFRALLDASWFDRVLFDCGAGPGPGQVEQELQFALTAFLRAWQPAPEPKRATRTLPLTDPT